MTGHRAESRIPRQQGPLARDAARGPGHHVQVVGGARADDGAEVVRAQRGVLSVEERVVERQLGGGVVADRGVARGLEEAVHPPVAVLEMRSGPRVARVAARQRGLVEHRVRAAGGVGLREPGRRAEAAAPDLRGEAEVAVEGAVLLAGDDEVADRGGAGRRRLSRARRDGRRRPHGPAQQRRARCAGPPQERLAREPVGPVRRRLRGPRPARGSVGRGLLSHSWGWSRRR